MAVAEVINGLREIKKRSGKLRIRGAEWSTPQRGISLQLERGKGMATSPPSGISPSPPSFLSLGGDILRESYSRLFRWGRGESDSFLFTARDLFPLCGIHPLSLLTSIDSFRETGGLHPLFPLPSPSLASHL